MNSESSLQRLFDQPGTEDILHFLETEDPEELESLFRFADRVRSSYVGDEIHLRAIIEFSNCCRNRCLYCGINASNTGLVRYRMKPVEVVAAAEESFHQGFRTVVLQSGEDPEYTAENLAGIVRDIRSLGEMAVTLAVGERSEEEYRFLFAAGARRFLLKHETSDPDLYSRLNPGMSLEYRLACLESLKKIGFETGSGIMLGLPGQTLASIAGDILLFKRMDIDMIGCGPFIPHPSTPLKNATPGNAGLSWKVVALCRIVTRDTLIPSTTALAAVDEEQGRIQALRCGANVVMPNLTPQPYRSYYEIYPNKGRIEAASPGIREKLEIQFRSIGRKIGSGIGSRKKMGE